MRTTRTYTHPYEHKYANPTSMSTFLKDWASRSWNSRMDHRRLDFFSQLIFAADNFLSGMFKTVVAGLSGMCNDFCAHFDFNSFFAGLHVISSVASLLEHV